MNLNKAKHISAEDIALMMGKKINFADFRAQMLADYRLAVLSRQLSLLGRREVLSGKAKFGILGDGKELPQIALAKVFKNGDFRSGYYRDQTLMLALKETTGEQFFAQLYANPNIEEEPNAGGRQMNAHYASRLLNESGEFLPQTHTKNTSADVSCTAGQMARALGLAAASKQYRNQVDTYIDPNFSYNGNEVIFVTIGDASTSEGVFWETVNAASVLKVPMVISVWDDGYGISVPTRYQTTKGSISEALAGFALNKDGEGIDIYTVYAWDYPSLCTAYRAATEKARQQHIPALLHVKQVTQPQGHSTSGSHERYKSKERLEWESQHDCNRKFAEWLCQNDIATAEELQIIDREAEIEAKSMRDKAWKDYNRPIKEYIREFNVIADNLLKQLGKPDKIKIVNEAKQEIAGTINATRRDIAQIARRLLFQLHTEQVPAKNELVLWKDSFQRAQKQLYNTYLYSQSSQSPLHVKVVPPQYNANSPYINGYEILNHCFDAMLKRDSRVMAFGEDVGKIGDVNQGFAGLQEKYGENRVFDVGIRENTIIGQGIGLALRGWRPIAEIQYLDYLLYGLQPLSDDLASLHYRTCGGQKAPLIVRTRGHRLEGIWHAGSPMGMILHSTRGIYLAVPRNMVQAAGFYNTFLLGDNPAIVVECLNGYRQKERLPDNISEFTLPLGVPEVLREGTDITIVTYGSCCAIARQAADWLSQVVHIKCEIIDVQTLLPFDLQHVIVQSLQKTNRILFLDEDVPGGASAYMMQQVLEQQQGYRYLDSPPATLTASEHRPPYGSDGDYYSKPSIEDVIEKVYAIMHESQPARFPAL